MVLREMQRCGTNQRRYLKDRILAAAWSLEATVKALKAVADELPDEQDTPCDAQLRGDNEDSPP